MTPIRILLAAIAASLAVHAWAATVTVVLRNFEFSPNDVTIQAGDTIDFVNQSGTHNVKAEDGSFGNVAAVAPWTFSHTFAQAGEVRVYCSVHSVPGVDISVGMNARITVTPAVVPFSINRGISGAWYNPQIGGQGILFDIDPASNFLFGAWFTYDPDAPVGAGTTYLWLSLQGNYSGSQAQIPIYRTSGGLFNQASATTTSVVGNATVNFTSCTAGTVTYQFTSPVRSGTIPIARAIPGSESLCQQLDTSGAAGAGGTPLAR